MINIKVCYRENGTVSSIVSQGHAKADICFGVTALMQACGNELVDLKSAKMDIEEDGICCITDIRQSKPALAVVDALVKGLVAVERQNQYSVSIMKLK